MRDESLGQEYGLSAGLELEGELRQVMGLKVLRKGANARV